MSVINIEHISKLYGDRMVLEDLSASVDAGDKVGIIGVNGTGKSTLLRILAGAEEPDEGTIIFSRGMTVGWLPQNPDFPEKPHPRLSEIPLQVCCPVLRQRNGYCLSAGTL